MTRLPNCLIEPAGWSKDEITAEDHGKEKGAWGTAESCGVSQGRSMKEKQHRVFSRSDLQKEKVLCHSVSPLRIADNEERVSNQAGYIRVWMNIYECICSWRHVMHFLSYLGLILQICSLVLCPGFTTSWTKIKF